MPAETINDLLELSHELGRPDRRLAILGEGNTSARADTESFWVKASGSELGSLRTDQMVRVSLAACLELLDGPDLSDTQIKDALLAAVVEGGDGVRPSVETVLHAALLELPGIGFVGHTHPESINALTCSDRFGEVLRRRLFPDQIVVCGPSAVLVPYVDPGLPLARAVLAGARAYADEHGEPPKTVFMQNHGFIALGKSAKQVLQVTQMADKSARILGGAFACGSPTFMTAEQVRRIHGRDDEHYRQRVLNG
jgi:rhamnose utilization protein RhaD (predicted bifunctional aldolase and dehydrogenase)